MRTSSSSSQEQGGCSRSRKIHGLSESLGFCFLKNRTHIRSFFYRAYIIHFRWGTANIRCENLKDLNKKCLGFSHLDHTGLKEDWKYIIASIFLQINSILGTFNDTSAYGKECVQVARPFQYLLNCDTVSQVAGFWAAMASTTCWKTYNTSICIQCSW